MKLFQDRSNESSERNLAFPFPDESIIANLDNIISVFGNPSRVSELNLAGLQNVLNELKTVKQKLAEINENVSRSGSTEVSRRNSVEFHMMNPITRSSIEMLKNHGKFTELINPAPLNSKEKSEKRNLKENVKSFVHRSPSISSLRNSIKISPCSFGRRKPPLNAKMLARKISQLNIAKKPEKKLRQTSKPLQEPKKPPKILSTLYASCRIHCYDDNSHTFEIIKPHQGNPFGDTYENSEVVFVVLPNGSSALFKSRGGNSLLKLKAFEEKQ